MGELGLRGRLPIHYHAESLKFSLYSKEEILKLSVVEILNPSSFNHLGHPSENGLYDLRMGPFSSREHTACSTCHLEAESCSGHIGHIKLPMPVINPLFYQNIQKLLKISCIHCHRLTIRDYMKTLFVAEMQLLNLGLISQAQQVRDLTMAADEKDEKNTELQIREFVDTQLQKHKSQVEKVSESEMANRMLDGLRKGYAKEIWQIGAGSKSKCHRCGSIVKSIIKSKTGFIYNGNRREDDDDDDLVMNFSLTKSDKKSGQEKFELNPRDLMQHFRTLYKAEKEVLDFLFPVLKTKCVDNPTDLFFVEVLPVPPPRSRPAQFTEGGLSIHPQTVALTNVVHSVITMRQLLQVIGGTPVESLSTEVQDLLKALQGETPALQLDHVWKELQTDVDHVLDKNMNTTKATTGGWGLKQLIERKEGLFRMNMMGKRVNHACRTVITPDPFVSIDEIGVPEVFAKKLVYPVPVTPFNVRELREMILNGPEKHPGANMVEDEFGRMTYLGKRDYNQRLMIANTLLTPTYRNKYVQRPKIVHRHLKNGDAMLLNRQPTLHRPSIMGHKARVLGGEKVFRLHYSNCKSYNADFDGDEMNAHFPQSENGRSEAYNICLSAHQYLGPKDGAPLQGLIQDHVIAGVKMTLRGRFFDRSEYLQMVFQALQNAPGKIKTLPPSIIKPKVLWSGKQVLSTILINVIPADKPAPNFAGSAKIRSKLWQNVPPRPWKAGGKPEKNDVSMSESDVVIRDGLLCSGILDKSQYGATAYSLAHLLYELYGEKSCCSFLSGISKLFTFFLQSVEGFTLGVDDIIVTDQANIKRKEVMKSTANIGEKCAAKGVGAKVEVDDTTLRVMMEESHRSHNPRARMELDAGYKEFLNPATNDINAICVPKGLIKPFPANNLQLMVNSGAKGSTVNTTQISCLLGQIELEGKRPPVMISGKSLPSFPAYCTLPRAGGYIDGRFMTGIQPQEFFFHCMAGREGLIDTAVKTSRSGYLQRCLIKLLEGLTVHHDFTVRDSDNTVVQFQYGEDSMDICKSQYIKPSRLKDLANNLSSVLDTHSVQVAKDCSDRKAIKSKKKELKNWDKNPEVAGKPRFSPFLSLSGSQELTAKHAGFVRSVVGKDGDDLLQVSRPKVYGPACKKYRNLDSESRSNLEASVARRPDPVASSYLPPLHFSSLTEVCDQMINKYVKENKKDVDSDKFKDAMYLKVQKASVCPGEPVGVLAAQSVGEPSTQMTLNTFHFAGRGEMNVTLGIPRLREILMVASENIKTPSISVPFLPHVGEKERDKLRLKFNRVLVSDILEEVQVKEKLILKPNRVRNITLRYKFIPHKYYKKDFGIKPAQVLTYMETKFFSKVFKPVMVAISKEKMSGIKVTEDKEAKKASAEGDEEGDSDRQAENVADQAMGNLGDDSDDEEVEDVEGEGTDVARKVARRGDLEYEELEEEDIKIKKEARTDQDDLDEDADEDQNKIISDQNSDDEALGGMDFEDPEDPEDDPAANQDLLNDEVMATGEPAKRRVRFLALMDGGLAGLGSVVDYKFDTEKEQWCEVTLSFDVSTKKPDMVNIIRKSAERGVIHEVRNIKKAFVMEKDGTHHLQTDGINIQVMYNFDHLLDINKLHANNIHDMARYYGIEAAYKTIVREVKNVFGVYGIEVDYRHLSLIADFMTIDGTYRPFNRIGIDNNTSPLQQMTFETAIGFLRAATLGAKRDYLSSPSACIIAGKQAKVGTGSVHLQYKL